MLARLTSARISTSDLGTLLVVLAIASSSVVFMEPAPADALLIGVVIAVIAFRLGRHGPMALQNLAIWLVIVATGLAGTLFSTNMDTAVPHQLVTLYLALAAFAIAGYVAADPVPRAQIVLGAYVVASLIATAAAFVGYFGLVPGTEELFTNFDRARGTFKDPNVYGAAITPAIVTTLWVMLRAEGRRATIAGGISVVLSVGVLISFSRGAWLSTAIACVTLVWLMLVRSRRRSDFSRFTLVASAGTIAVLLALGAALQVEQIVNLATQRASLEQSYDVGPEGRFGGQEKAVGLVLENPLGIGTHTFRDTYHSEETHNVYLSMFLNAGWLGGLLYIVTVVATLAVALRGAVRNTALQGAYVVAAAAYVGMVVEGFVIDTDHWRHFFIFTGLIWGLADAAPVALDKTRRRSDRIVD